LRAQRDTLSLLAYQRVLDDPAFFRTFLFSVQMALWTIVFSILLIVPTAFWVHLRLPQLRPAIELVTLMPFVIPGIVLVFGLIRTYGRPPFPLVSSPALLVAGYTVLALPYMYRAVDTGLRAVDIRTLTEAALSLGAGWPRSCCASFCQTCAWLS
jgi:putative spermidine/putrescine transport system permease protein